jgi:glyceraldehyde 3-phosphate dehydrogenase
VQKNKRCFNYQRVFEKILTLLTVLCLLSNMMKIAINGFGRIGRLTLKYLLDTEDVEVVAINDLTDNKTLAHLLKYDSVHGRFDREVSADDQNLYIEQKTIRAFSEKDPAKLPWKELDVDLVLEATGFFTHKDRAQLHLDSGAKKVLISAPGKGGVKMIVMGVNDNLIESDDLIISNASCTTNCLAPMVRLLEDAYGIENGFMTTVHAYTAQQNLHDGPHKDLRRARAAAYSIVPTTSGAATAVGKVIPEIEGKLHGKAMRVPVPDGSATDLTINLKKEVSAEEINALFKNAAEGKYKGIIEYETDPIVSIDIIGNKHSCVFDALSTSVIGKTANLLSWYDNEAGYSARLVDLMVYMAKM